MPQQPHPATLNPVVRLNDVCRELGIGRQTFYDWQKRGKVPLVTRMSPGAVGVRRQELERWLAERLVSPPGAATSAGAWPPALATPA